MHRVAFTVDVEQDAPPFMATWRGMNEGMPPLLALLSRHGVRATFFVTGAAASRFPQLIAEISRNHEVGCHGYDHERFDRLPVAEQRARIRAATDILQQITGAKPSGFRAPNFRCTADTLKILAELGYTYDASAAMYHRANHDRDTSIVRLANTLPSSVLRLPSLLARSILVTCTRFSEPVVLDQHPWELVPMSGLRPDMRFATGHEAIKRLDGLLAWLTSRGVHFVLMRDIAAERMHG